MRAATTVALALSIVFFAPVAVATWRVDASAVPWIVASAALELVYFVFLVAAYSRSDVSLVYPIARGTAPVLVLFLGAFVGATVGVRQAVGVVLVGVGVILVRGVRGTADGRGVALALVIGVAIAGYTLVDNEGIEHAAAVPYLVLVLAPVAMLAVLHEAAAGRLGALADALGPGTVAAALASFGSYALVLAALALAPTGSRRRRAGVEHRVRRRAERRPTAGARRPGSASRRRARRARSRPRRRRVTKGGPRQRCYPSRTTFHLFGEMGASRPFFLRATRFFRRAAA